MNQYYEKYIDWFKIHYGSIQHWPLPYQYQQNYNFLSQQVQQSTLNPSLYTQIYSYAYHLTTKNFVQKNKKLSRSEKRKNKKQNLLRQLQNQKQKIGNWVKLQCKDLINQIDKIQKKQLHQKTKKKQKLGHLIQINKQITKFMKKKQITAKIATFKQKKKKRLSDIKKLKLIFQQKQKNNKTLNNINNQDQWQSQQEISQYKQNTQKNQNKIAKQIILQPIEYDQIGKLTGSVHNKIVLRQWVKNCPSEKLDDIVLRLVNRLAYKQAIRKIQKPNKAKKLIVSGLRQCKRTLTTIIEKKRSRILIVALNIQRNPYKGGTDDQVQSVIKIAQQMKIPIIHACLRSELGKAFTGKWGPRSTIISIINYEGYQDMMQELLNQWNKARMEYNILK